MSSENKNQTAPTNANFSVARDVLYPHLRSDDLRLNNIKNAADEHILSNAAESSAGIDAVAIEKIEEQLKLTYLSEKDVNSQVCMANNPEVRDDFKDIFDLKDLINYCYAELYAPKYLGKDLSNVPFFQIPYPKDTFQFWKLVNLGAELRILKLSGEASAENHRKETNDILRKIAAIKST